MKPALIAAILLLPLSPAAMAQKVEKDLGTNGDWKGALVTEHNLWKKNACIAFAKSPDGGSFIELYAEQAGDTRGSFVEPTVQLVTKEANFVRGTLSDSTNKESYQLVLAPTREQKPALGLITRLGDRQKVVAMLKRASGAKVQLLNAKGQVLKTLTFSLKGSTKAIEGAFSACKLIL